ncbi:MAG: ABC transporter permease [Bacteroidetes bacterium]|nr:ABC transporter permease [Bacteroidota bacterium]
MNISNLLKVAIYALKRNKLRALLTMLGIIIGVASVIAMLAIGQGSKKSIQDQISTMGTNLVFVMPGSQQRGGIQMGNSGAINITVKDMDVIRAECPSISDISPEVRANGQAVYGNKNWPTSLFGSNAEYFKIKKIEVGDGRCFTDKEVKSAAKVCLIGETVVENLFGKNANPIGLTVRYKKIPFKIIGILKPKGTNTFGQDQDDLLLAPYTTVQKRVLAITYFQSIQSSAASETKTKDAAKEMEQALRKSHKIKEGAENDFTIRSQDELVSTFSSISNVLTILLGAIASISLLVGGIGIMNIMYVSVTERTREIGLRMAVGGRGKDILMQFLIESILLSVLGGVIGILLGVGASSLIGTIMKWPVVVLPTSVVLAFFVCTVIGVFFGWYPARKAASLNPIDALRFE